MTDSFGYRFRVPLVYISQRARCARRLFFYSGDLNLQRLTLLPSCNPQSGVPTHNLLSDASPNQSSNPGQTDNPPLIVGVQDCRITGNPPPVHWCLSKLIRHDHENAPKRCRSGNFRGIQATTSRSWPHVRVGSFGWSSLNFVSL